MLWGFGVLERSVVLDAPSAGILCSYINGSETPGRWDSGGIRLFASRSLLSRQTQKPGARICRLGTNQLANRCPLRPLGNFDGCRRRPRVQVLPPADLANAGLEQSRADHLARAGSGGNRLPWIRADIAAPFSETHRLAVRAFGGSDGCGRDICGGSHWECRDHLVTARLHRSDGMSLRHAATKLSIDRGSCARAFDIQ